MDPTKSSVMVNITVSDVVTINADGAPAADERTVTSSRTLSWNPASPLGVLQVQDIPYRLDPNRELPRWFVRNDWHKLVYVASARSMQLGGDDDCVSAPPDCLWLQVDGATVNKSLALGVLSMRDRNSSTSTPADFLEGVNVTVGVFPRVLQRDPPTANFDDGVEGLLQSAPGTMVLLQ